MSAARLELMEELEKFVPIALRESVPLTLAIREVEKKRKYKLVAFLKLMVAVFEGDIDFVVNLFGAKKGKLNIPSEVKSAGRKLSLKAPMQLARQNSRHSIFSELLINTGHHNSELNWNNLDLNDDILYTSHIFERISHVTVLCLSQNHLRTAPDNFLWLNQVSYI